LYRYDHGETTTMTLEREGLFDVSVHKILLESELLPETIFECLLNIPGTSFTMKEDSMYLRGKGIHNFKHSPNATLLGCPFIRHIFFIRIMNIFDLLFEYSNNIQIFILLNK
jgi:hypothetical protein